MVEQVLGTCSSCGQVYSVRKHGDALVVPTSDGNCRCGNESFREVTAASLAG
ncbi:hypothetical protein [Halomarina rubra]|uniref:Small CPxCG-related zinc finger protein n=1 Tax=Halomarina rubra TaxID=2071873 RepID=A0ABD6B0U4_9EURY|nr:hypothetical protein [Halomarina rubra]